MQRGIGCKYCDYTGVIECGTGRVWVSGGEAYEDLFEEPCPYCTPPELPDLDLDDSDMPEFAL
jgi:hypothetical protein